MALPINVTDPGVVNVEDQAYPPILPTIAQVLPPNLALLLAGSAFAPPPVPPGSQALANFVFTQVENQAARPPSFSSGVADPTETNVDVSVQSSVRLPIDEFLVTEVGNFRTSLTPNDFTNFTITAITNADTGAAPTTGDRAWRISLNRSLVPFGVDFFNKQMLVITNADPSVVSQSRLIQFFSVNTIVILVDEGQFSFGSILAVGNILQIATGRDGDEVVYQTGANDVDVTIFPAPPTSPPVNFTLPGNAPTLTQATDGIVNAFIGGGVRIPLILGTFEVEEQVPVGRGLPANVFI